MLNQTVWIFCPSLKNNDGSVGITGGDFSCIVGVDISSQCASNSFSKALMCYCMVYVIIILQCRVSPCRRDMMKLAMTISLYSCVMLGFSCM